MKKICSLFLIILIALYCLNPIISVAIAEASLVDIQFKDVNLYNAIVSRLGSEISSKDDDTLTIKMTQENIESVTYLNLNRKK